ncbi:MAG TPA: hypothetical protein VFP27_10290 [Mycobacterium sp.]|nr:hypothetical protein [Mycobacterium sp.]
MTVREGTDMPDGTRTGWRGGQAVRPCTEPDAPEVVEAVEAILPK